MKFWDLKDLKTSFQIQKDLLIDESIIQFKKHTFILGEYTKPSESWTNATVPSSLPRHTSDPKIYTS